MDLSSLLASFASAFDQNNRLLSLDIGTDQHWDGVLLPQQVEGSEAVSDKRLHLYSLEEVLIEALKITLRAQGAEIALGGGSIITQASGNHTQKAANHSMEGPGNGRPQLPNMPKSEANTNETFSVVRRSGQASHEISNSAGKLVSSGKTATTGETSEVTGKTIDTLKMLLKRNH